MIVVTQENLGGSSRRYGSETSRRNARRPELRSGIFIPVSRSGELADEPLGGHAEHLVGALLGGPRPDDLVDRLVLLQ